VSIVSTGMLWFDVLRRVDELTVTRSDNTQWTISQLEVDTLRMALAIEAAETGGGQDLAAVRQRFDILYSRFRTLERASTYRLLFGDADYLEAQDEMAGFLERQLRFIDGTDAELRAALPAIAADTMEAHAAVRAMALRGLHVFAEVSDRQRSEVVGLILRTGIGAALLLAVLAVVLLMLLQTGRRAAAAARRTAEANRNLAMIVNTSLDAIVLADDKGVVRAFNPAAEATFGWTSDEAIGRPMTELMIPEHHHAAHDAGMKRFVETGERRVIGAGRVQLDARHKSGRVFPVELSLSTERDETGRIFVAFLRDITRRREAEDALTAARDDALAGARKKAEFLAMMSHEIRTPLNGMLGAIELLGDSPLDPRQERWLATLKGSGQLLLQHVNDVLDLSRLDAGQAGLRRERVDLRALCAEVVASQDAAARAAGNTNSCVISDAVPEAVRIDGRRLFQVLLNLLGNANKFTRNGAVRVSVDAHPSGPGRFGLEIHVTDTGIGIPADDRDRIFEEFVMLDTSYHRDGAGTGLGLAISRRIVQSMGGRIDVIDTPGGGADFRIDLEVEAETQRARARTVSVMDADPTAVRRLDILLVEDNAVNREILREMLERDGHGVTEATDGADAVEKAGSRRFDLILMDISMPGHGRGGVDHADPHRRGPECRDARGRRHRPCAARGGGALPPRGNDADGHETGRPECAARTAARAAPSRRRRRRVERSPGGEHGHERGAAGRTGRGHWRGALPRHRPGVHRAGRRHGRCRARGCRDARSRGLRRGTARPGGRRGPSRGACAPCGAGPGRIGLQAGRLAGPGSRAPRVAATLGRHARRLSRPRRLRDARGRQRRSPGVAAGSLPARPVPAG
jgi:PAS domain S-box-containing protein